MATYLLTWNPALCKWSDQGIERDVAFLREGHSVETRWSCGVTGRIAVADRVFFLKQGDPPRGIIASGYITREVYEAEHWDESRMDRNARYVRVEFDSLINYLSEPVLAVEALKDAIPGAHWHPAASGTSINDDAAVALERMWIAHLAANGLGANMPLLATESVPVFVEGELRVSSGLHRSRERRLRVLKIHAAQAENPLLPCEVPGCGFSFVTTYGELGREYAQVHHLEALAAADGARETTPDDLAVVCANCHAMIHRGGACRPLEGLIPRRKGEH